MNKRFALISGMNLGICGVLLGIFCFGITAKSFAEVVLSKDASAAQTIYNQAQTLEDSREYQQAKLTYEKIVTQCPNSTYANKALLQLSKIEISETINSRDVNGAIAKVNKLTTDFSGNPDLSFALCDIASCFRQRGQYENAANICNSIIKNYPDPENVFKAKSELAIVYALNHQDSNSMAMVNSLLTSFAKNEDLPARINEIAEQSYYAMALRSQRNGDSARAKRYFESAINIWKAVPATDSNVTPKVNIAIGDCYYKIGEYSKSIESYQNTATSYPKHPSAWHALFMTGFNYEKLIETGAVSESQADHKIQAAYQQLLEKYPDCKAAAHAMRWLVRHNIELPEDLWRPRKCTKDAYRS